MAVFVALLRGINVGGKNRIKMAALKEAFESIGFLNVETYIQSGNVLFESNENEDSIQKKIEHELENRFGSTVCVVLRTADELQQLIENCPFSKQELAEAQSLNTEGESFYVSLLAEAPSQEKQQLLTTENSEDGRCLIKNRDIYLLLFCSIRNSKLANSIQKLGVPSTVRNWKTIKKLQELAKYKAEEC